MGLFNRLASGSASSNQGVRLVEQWCAEVGWGIDGRVDSTGIVLDFKDSLIGIRKLLITVSDSGRVAGFVAFSGADLQMRQLTGKLMAYLLCHNSEILGGWHMKVNDDGEITLAVAHTCILAGMTTNEFKAVCVQLLREANDLDTKLNNSEF